MSTVVQTVAHVSCDTLDLGFLPSSLPFFLPSFSFLSFIPALPAAYGSSQARG